MIEFPVDHREGEDEDDEGGGGGGAEAAAAAAAPAVGKGVERAGRDMEKEADDGTEAMKDDTH